MRAKQSSGDWYNPLGIKLELAKRRGKALVFRRCDRKRGMGLQEFEILVSYKGIQVYAPGDHAPLGCRGDDLREGR